jgi:uncharacterized membrane protein
VTTVAFAMVLAAAASHASWNFLLKVSGHKVAFLWSFGAVSFVAFAVPAGVFAYIDGIDARGVMFGIVSAAIHGVYGLALARGYQIGDLSTVYPTARGMGLALIPPAAVVFLGENLSAGAGAGIGVVIVGIYLVQSNAGGLRGLALPVRDFGRPAAGVALLTGVLVAAYSVWDKAALDHLPPITLNQFAITGHVVVLAPLALGGRAEAARSEWRERRWSILAAGMLAFLGYMLILFALTTSRVSYVAPTRQVSIVLGALLGVVLLGEGYGPARVCGAVLIVAGALLIGLSP